MKLKEYWPSFKTAWRLKRLKAEILCSDNVNTLPVIVTLTSIPSRLEILHITIRSLLNQSCKPEKIVLWLNNGLKGKLPDSLTKLICNRFEIRYVDLTCSHRKLIHSLVSFPDRILVTCDDDLMYDSTWLERLYKDHLIFPTAVIAHECRRITRNPVTGEFLPYTQWPTETKNGVSEDALVPIGYGGVLYPPGALLEEAIDVDKFMLLAPKADDLWFKAMSWLNGTPVRKSSQPKPKPTLIINSQNVSLLKTNVREDGNRKQWEALCQFYEINLPPI